MFRFMALILIGVMFVLPSICAQTDSLTGLRAASSMRVHGESLVSVVPDEVEMDMAVLSEATTAEAASAQNVVAVNRLIESLRSKLPASNIKTINLAINPNFSYPKDGTPKIQGYTANSTLRVTLDNLDLLGLIIASSTKAGASSINRLNFILRAESDRKARAQALAEAAAQAAAGATALAASLKLTLSRILRVEEGQPLVISPAPQIDLGKAQSTNLTPISPGYIQIHANVNLEYEVLTDSPR